MKRKITISVDKPCSEKWDSFTKNEMGGFCGSCQKTVIDFTQFTDREVLDYFTSDRPKLCGHFRADQLKTYTDVNGNQRGYTKIISFALSMLTLVPISNSFASTRGKVAVMELTNASPQQQPKGLPTTSTEYRITGQVVSAQEDEALPGVNILIKGTSVGICTDVNGNFEIIYNGEANDSLTLIFSYIGYVTLEKAIILNEPITKMEVVKIEGHFVPLTGITIVGGIEPYRRGIWWRIKNLFVRH